MGANETGTEARLLAALCALGIFGAWLHARRAAGNAYLLWCRSTRRQALQHQQAVALGFLDFSRLGAPARSRALESTCAIPRRLAPDLYLDVVPITGSVDAPVLGGEGPALEDAVKTREFPQAALASAQPCTKAKSRPPISMRWRQESPPFTARRTRQPLDESLRRTGRRAARGTAELCLNCCCCPARGSSRSTTNIDALAAWTEREHASRRAAFLQLVRGGASSASATAICTWAISRASTASWSIFDCIEFQRVDALDRRHERGCIHGHGPRGSQARRPGPGAFSMHTSAAGPGTMPGWRYCASIWSIAPWYERSRPSARPGSSLSASKAGALDRRVSLAT